MTSAASGASGSLPQTVRQTREKLVALLAAADPAAAEWVERVRADRPAKPAVVVVGETNRGKSSLVNALLARPGLSPVEADVATATYLVFGHHERWRARACYPGRYEPVPFDVARLADWASLSHELPAGQLPPRHLAVDGPVPLLERLTVIDTPGVGGLNSIHGELAREAAATATALLFTADASGPLTAGELAFLAEVGERVETVVFALTKIDAFRGWREIQAENQRLLAEHAPRFARAGWFPCSARMFELAAGTANPDAAALLRERAGIAELQVRLQELLIGRSAMLVEANSLRALSTALSGLQARRSAEAAALRGGADTAVALRARRDELTGRRRSSTRGGQVKLRGEIQRARVETAHQVSREMREVQTWFRQAIDAAGRDELAGLPAQVDTALRLVSGRCSGALNERLSRVAERSLAELFAPEELALLGAQLARGEAPPLTLRPPERRTPTAEDKLLVFMGVTGGFGAARVAALPLGALGVAGMAALSPIVLPATIVIGLGAGWWLARTRKHTAEKQHVRQWLTEAIADARSTLDQLVAEQLIEAELQFSLALDDAVGRRIEAIDAELREVDRTMKLAAGERSRRLAAVTGELAELAAGRDRAEALLGTIRTLRDRA